MKLDPVFSVKDNSLYFVDGKPVLFSDSARKEMDMKEFIELADLSAADFFVVKVNHSEIELDDDVYNEEILASFREKLLVCDEQNKYVVIHPVSDKDLSSAVNLESFNNTFNHTARRVKDCVSVAGFILPENLLSAGEKLSAVNDFMAVIAKKHAQYVYFASADEVSKASASDGLKELPVVIF